MTYHKIHAPFKRGDRGEFLAGKFARPEFAYLWDADWTWTEKVDGTNIRLSYQNGFFRENEHAHIYGRTDNAQLPPKLLTVLVDLMKGADFEGCFPDFGPTDQVVLHGEGYGAGIQKGGKYRLNPGFVLFDVWIGDSLDEGGVFLERHNVEDVAVKLGLEIVPVVRRGTLAEAMDFVRTGFKSDWGDFPAEGIVARPTTELCDRQGRRIITKIKTKDFK